MITVSGSHITMHSGDYGIPLLFRIIGGEFLPADKFRFAIDKGGVEILHKEFLFSEIEGDALMMTFSAEESEQLPPGRYKWCMTLIREDGTQQNTFAGPCTMEVIDCGA